MGEAALADNEVLGDLFGIAADDLEASVVGVPFESALSRLPLARDVGDELVSVDPQIAGWEVLLDIQGVQPLSVERAEVVVQPRHGQNLCWILRTAGTEQMYAVLIKQKAVADVRRDGVRAAGYFVDRKNFGLEVYLANV